MLIFSFYKAEDAFTKIPCMNIIYKHENSADNRNVSTLVGTSKLATQNRAVHKTMFCTERGQPAPRPLKKIPRAFHKFLMWPFQSEEMRKWGCKTYSTFRSCAHLLRLQAKWRNKPENRRFCSAGTLIFMAVFLEVRTRGQGSESSPEGGVLLTAPRVKQKQQHKTVNNKNLKQKTSYS